VQQFSLFGPEVQIWTVSDLTRYVRQSLESDYRLQDLWVSGEVFNVSRPASGHLYFTLKDVEASLRCVMWRSEVDRQTYMPRDGEAVEVRGRISVYEAGGQYQLYADTIRPAGEGELYREFLRIRALLEAEGLFDPDRKRPLPLRPQRLGLVTSPTGAALRDVLTVLRRRFPMVEVILSPTPVQGEAAPAGIVNALSALNEYSKPEVILLVRGGGSIEDLWAFNDENVARAVAASAAPVVTGIGHATDILISDFVADVRAPTPSAAAEVAVPDQQAIAEDLRDARIGMGRTFQRQLFTLRVGLDDMLARLRMASPRAQVDSAKQRVDVLLHRAIAAIRHGLALRRSAISGTANTLRAIGPAAVLARGFAVVLRSDDGTVVRSVDHVSDGDELDVHVSDGVFGAEVRPADQQKNDEPRQN
jgi:exodeoxyribonuclease VII large subunit